METIYFDNKSVSNAALQVLMRYWDNKIPVNPQHIAEKMGFTVKMESSDYSGKAYRENDTPIIEFNRVDSELRQRFTIAHELGHHVLGHTQNNHQFRDKPKQFDINTTAPEEIQANKFAAELLMPEIIVEHLIFNKNITDLNKLAQLFKVSPLAMKYRLINLGYL